MAEDGGMGWGYASPAQQVWQKNTDGSIRKSLNFTIPELKLKDNQEDRYQTDCFTLKKLQICYKEFK